MMELFVIIKNMVKAVMYLGTDNILAISKEVNLMGMAS
jgi:hypothetical protein